MGYLAESLYGQKWGTFARIISVFGCVALNGSIIIGGVVEVSAVLSQYLNFNQFLLKICILCMVLFITSICLEPEKLKPVGYLSGGVIICIGNPFITKLQ